MPNSHIQSQNKLLFAGMFIISSGLLLLEVFMTRILAFTIGPYKIYSTLAVAMLSLGTAASVISIIKKPIDLNRSMRLATYFSVAAAFCTLILVVWVVLWRQFILVKLDQLFFGKQTFSYFLDQFEIIQDWSIVIHGILMGMPYFCYGLVLAVLFRGVNKQLINRLYAFDLFGACFGVLLAILSLEFFGYVLPLAATICLPLVAAVCFSLNQSKKLSSALAAATVALLFLLNIPSIKFFLEPKPHLPTAARAWEGGTNYGFKLKELWREWSSFGRISAMSFEDTEQGKTTYAMVHGNGDGHAHINANLTTELPSMQEIASIGINTSPSEDILVLLAGAGNDMVYFDEIAHGKANITGVELVPSIVNWPTQQKEFLQLKKILDQKHINLLSAEAREFLSRNKQRYDFIFLSWAGHSISYYTGSAANGTRYLVSKEGIKSMVDHLSDDGTLIIVNHNKVKILLTLQTILEEAGEDDFTNKFYIYSRTKEFDFWAPSDNHTLIFKPNGFLQEQVELIQSITKENNRIHLYVPGMPLDLKNPYSIIASVDNAKELIDVIQPSATDFSPNPDDRPYSGSTIERHAGFKYLFYNFNRNPNNIAPVTLREIHDKTQDVLRLIAFSILAFIVILIPVWFRLKKEMSSEGIANHMLFFGSIGAGFMFIEVGLIQKLSLLVGHPGYALGLVLSSMILFTGIGSFCSPYLFQRQLLNFQKTALLIVLSNFLLLIIYQNSIEFFVGLPRVIKMLITFIFPAIPSFFMGHLFPQGLMALTEKNEHLVPWAFAINATTSTIATGMGIVFAFSLGFNGVILLGVLCYIIVFFMPHSLREI